MSRNRHKSAELDDLLKVMGLRRIGRPRAAVIKQSIGLRLDRDIVAAFRTTGSGWHTRMNEALRRAMEGERARLALATGDDPA